MRAEVTAVLDHHLQALTVRSVASELGVSVRRLQLSLAAEQATFREIRRNWQIAFAMRLLSETGSSIGEIARRAGYNNLSNFYRAFIALTGTTPGRYRAAALAA